MGKAKLMKDWDFRGKSREKQRQRSKLLKEKGDIGDFMLRNVETRPGCLGLVVKIAPGITKNFLVEQTEDWKSYVVSGNAKTFPTIPALLQFFATNLLDPFPVRLTDPNAKKKKRSTKAHAPNYPQQMYGMGMGMMQSPIPRQSSGYEELQQIQQLTAQNSPQARQAAQAHFDLMRKKFEAQQSRVSALQAAINHVKHGGDSTALNQIMGDSGLLSPAQQQSWNMQEKRSTVPTNTNAMQAGLPIANPGDSVSTIMPMSPKKVPAAKEKKVSKKQKKDDLDIFNVQEKVLRAHESEQAKEKKQLQSERETMDAERKKIEDEKNKLEEERRQLQLETLQKEMELQRKELETQRRIMEEERVNRMEEREQLFALLDEEKLRSEESRVSKLKQRGVNAGTNPATGKYGSSSTALSSSSITSYKQSFDDYNGDDDGEIDFTNMSDVRWQAELARRKEAIRQRQEDREKATTIHATKIKNMEMEEMITQERQKYKKEMEAKLNAIIEAEELRRRKDRELRAREKEKMELQEAERLRREIEDREARAKEEIEKEELRIAREKELLDQLEAAKRREQDILEQNSLEKAQLKREEQLRLAQLEKEKRALRERIKKEREQRHRAEQLSLTQLESQKSALIQQQQSFETALAKIQREAMETKASAQRALQDVERRQRLIQEQHHTSRMDTLSNNNIESSSSSEDEAEGDTSNNIHENTSSVNDYNSTPNSSQYIPTKMDLMGDTNLGDLAALDDDDAMSNFSDDDGGFGFSSLDLSGPKPVVQPTVTSSFQQASTSPARNFVLPSTSSHKTSFEEQKREPLKLVKFKKPQAKQSSSSFGFPSDVEQCTFLGNCTCPNCKN